MQYFGDSFDVVKRFLLANLVPEASWVTLPMFTHSVTDTEVRALERFLGVEVVTHVPIENSTDRGTYFSTASNHRHVFLDPDTGIKLKPVRGKNSAKYVFAHEIEQLCQMQSERLLLVFDQSVGRGSEKAHVSNKISYFAEMKISAFAYLSHACFMVLSSNAGLTQQARARLLSSGLPMERLV
jgi:hypothetical protein